MTVNYTTNLQLGQPVTGTESGTWGDDVNNSVTSYLDIAIAGGLAITVTTTDVTLTLTQGTSSATNIGSTTAQYAILNISGAMTAARNLILPSSSRQYVINNNTTGGFALTVKGAATTGVTMVNGESSHIYWNGSDYAKLSNATGGAGSFTNLTYTGTLTGSTGVIAIGTNQIYKDSSGNLGIGTSSPSAQLHVVAASGAEIARFETANASASNPYVSWAQASTRFGYIGSASQILASGAVNDLAIRSQNNLVFASGGTTERMRIDSSGNVGIGTSSPNQKLQVHNTAASSSFALFTNATTGSTGSDGTYFGVDSSGLAYVWNQENTAMLFGTNNGERMRIDSSGNVGIGTSTPSVKLEVLNNIKANSTTTIPAIISQSTQAAGYTPAQFQMYRVGASGGVTPDNSTIGEIRFDGSSLGGAYDNLGMIQVSGGVNATGGIPSSMIFSTASSGANATERMRIDSSGNVGIGTSGPSYNLHVRNGGGNGTIGVQYGTSTVTLLSAYAAQGDLQVTGANPLTFTNNSTERMRIDSSGNLLVGTTSAGGAGGVTIYPLGGGAGTAAIQVFNKTNTASDSAILFRVAGTTVSGISYTSTVVTYGTVSDYRLKTVVGAISDSGTRIDSLEPIEYTWNSNGQRARGFLAHKFQEVYASSVTGTKDAVDADGNPIHQGMQAGSTEVIADLVAEIQSLRKRLTALESKG